MVARLLESLQGITIWAGLGIPMMLVSSIHLGRMDKNFLKQTQNHPFIIYIAEYTTLMLPIFAWLLMTHQWLLMLVLVGFILLLSFTPWTLQLNNTHALFHYPTFMAIDFEWQIGIRKNMPFIIILYPLGLILSYLTATPLVIILLFAIITATFYLENGEEQTWLEIYANTPKAFLQRKIKRAVGLFLISVFPFIISFLIFHWQYWYILLIVVLIATVIQITSITLKYATYAPKARLQQNGIVLGFLLACWLTPFLQPVPLLMSIVYYRKGLRRLATYF